MTPSQDTVLRRLIALVAALGFPRVRGKELEDIKADLEKAATAVLTELRGDEQAALRSLSEKIRGQPKFRPPPEDLAMLRRVFGRFGLRRWVEKKHPDRRAAEVVADWLDRSEPGMRGQLLTAGIRDAIARASPHDVDLLDASFESFDKEKKMAVYKFDTRGLPSRFTDPTSGPAAQTAYVDKVKALLQGTFGLDLTTATSGVLNNQPTLSYVVGHLLLREVFDENAPSFTDAVGVAWTASLVKVKTEGSTTGTPLRQVLPAIIAVLDPAPAAGGTPSTGGTPGATIFFQELASIADHIVANADVVPFNHPSFGRQVLIARDRYISGPGPGESLEIPPLTGVGATDVEIEPENARAVGVIYVALQMERMRLFHVVDRITYYYMQGLLALPYDAASKALDDYYWSSEDRLNEAARNMTYGRVLGAPGTEVSRDVQPNKDFDSLLGRFIANVAEFDREQRVADLFLRGRGAIPASASQENIRKSGRDLLQNASLYGWGGTQASARRIKLHVIQALDILRLPQLQKLYGVTSPFQVIERVTINEFGQAPNIVKYRTMAEAGKNIMNVMARNFTAFALSNGRPLFTTPGVVGDINVDDTQVLINECNSWLAVNAIGAEQTEKMSKLEDTKYMPSMPANGSGKSSPDLVDKLQQMVKSGAPPSIDQIQQLLPSFK